MASDVSDQTPFNIDELGILARLAGDRLWESDENHIIVRVSDTNDSNKSPPAEAILAKHRWDFDGVDHDNELWSGHKATLDSHQPFEDFRYTREFPPGKTSIYRSPVRHDLTRTASLSVIWGSPGTLPIR